MTDLYSTFDMMYPFLCVSLGGFVLYVFKAAVKSGKAQAGLVLPLGIYLIIWHSWIYQRYHMLPEEFSETLLDIGYWFAHDAVLFLLIALALVPIFCTTTSPQQSYHGLEMEGEIRGWADATADLQLPEGNPGGEFPEQPETIY